MEPLATENPDETKKLTVEEVRGKAKCELLQWGPSKIKAFKISVGTSLEGLEEQVTGLFLLAIEARKKQKMLEESAHKKLAKSEGESGIEFSEFLEFENGSAKTSSSVSRERALVVHQ